MEKDLDIIRKEFLSCLSVYRDTSMRHLLASIPDRQPKKYLYDLVPVYPQRGGKGFRPGLCLATCKLFGGKEEEAMHSAVALELCHNAFLVHDDIEDESEDRRGLPTMHFEHGVPVALNVGDAMNVLALAPLMQNMHTLGPELTWQVFMEVQHMTLESVEGQAIELGWRKDNDCRLQDEDYLRMILKKTCWYTCIHPMRIGAIIGTKGKINPDLFNRFGYYLGASFQIQDDLLNLEGQRENYGKEIGGDILEGKRTLMLIHLLNCSTPKEKAKLKKYLSLPRPERSPEQTSFVMERMRHYECLEYGKKIAQNLTGAALKEFYTLMGHLPETAEKKFMENMIFYMINRDK